MIFDWWNNKETRQRIKAEQEERAATQISEIKRAYKSAKIPGPVPRHWLGKISKLRQLGKPLPTGLEHLSSLTISETTHAFIKSGKYSARAYFAKEYAAVRSQNLKITQKKFVATKLGKESQVKGGQISGGVRRTGRDKAAKEIIEAFKKSTSTTATANLKPVARLVAEWYLERFEVKKSKRAITQMLQRAGVAT